jgi:ribosomal protein S18 acetylase RimI-like enzyme
MGERATHSAAIRPARADDSDFLEAMLFEAFFWDASATRAPFSECRRHPEFAKLLSGWGRPGDHAVIAEDGGQPVGAAWFRLWTADLHSYGFVDATTPELGIAVSPEHRKRGIGRSLLRALIEVAREARFPALSLSVSPVNPARTLYESAGFQKVGESGTSWTLRLSLE